MQGLPRFSGSILFDFHGSRRYYLSPTVSVVFRRGGERLFIIMFKLSKKADYGLIAVKHLATHRNAHACSANEISEEYGISTTLMAKVLQKLARQGLVAAKHGSSGGYQLAKDPGQISALDVISAIDGPVLITSCVTSHGNCDATDRCSVREPLRRVNESILQVLGTVTISQMSEDPQEPALISLSGASRSLVSTT